MKKTLKHLLLVILILFDLIILTNFVGGIIAYNAIFSRSTTSDEVIAKIDDFDSNIEEEKVRYLAKDYYLQGYFFEVNDSDKLVLFVHGMKDYAHKFFSQQYFFMENGYNVFSFDGSGCGLSEGKTNGFSQSLIDLEYTLKFINNDEKFHKYKILLFGFSAGAYAVTSIFNLGDFNVLGSVAISGYNDAKTLIVDRGKDYIGPLTIFGEFVVNMMQKHIFDDYLKYDAISGINRLTKPIFISNSTKDTVINYNRDSIMIHKDEITNPNVKYYLDETKNHLDLMYSDKAIDLQKMVKVGLENLNTSGDEKTKKEYLAGIPIKDYFEINLDLFSRILGFYNELI